MAEKSKIVLSLGAALASLTGMSIQGAEAKPVSDAASTSAAENLAIKPEPNAHYQVGEDLLGFVMTKQADGTIVAQHLTRRMPHMRPMPQAAKDLPASPVEVAVDFDSSVQSLAGFGCVQLIA